MPDQPGSTEEEEALLRMIREAGSPETAAANLFARLESLEASVAEWEEYCAAHPEEAAAGGAPDAPNEATDAEAAVGEAGTAE